MNPPSAQHRHRPATRHAADHGQGSEVHLHIDRLVLDGLPFDTLQAAKVEASFTAELTRRLQSEPSLAARLGTPARSHPVPSVRLPPGVSPQAAGRAFAHALLRSVAPAVTTIDPAARISKPTPTPADRTGVGAPPPSTPPQPTRAGRPG